MHKIVHPWFVSNYNLEIKALHKLIQERRSHDICASLSLLCTKNIVHYIIYPWLLTKEITNICALHSLGQSVLKEGYYLITHKSNMTKLDNQSPSSAENDVKLPSYTHYV